MNTQGNTYTFLYASIMVVVIAAILSAAAIGLKPKQDRNVEIEKMSNILTTVKKGMDYANAPSKDAYIEQEFKKYISKSYTVNSNGDVVDGIAFNVDLHKELALPLEQRSLPVYECTDDDGSVKYILPVRGKGLWGPIWGYIALNNDLNTIYGAIFDHKGETPGLGAEINTQWFQEPFAGKKIFDEKGNFTSVKVVKGGANPVDLHSVDAISGGTITSKGLEKMLEESLSAYKAFFIKKLNN